jgi:hypothetical protein
MSKGGVLANSKPGEPSRLSRSLSDIIAREDSAKYAGDDLADTL